MLFESLLALDPQNMDWRAQANLARLALAEARWHAGRGLDRIRSELVAARREVRAEDRYQVD